MICSEVVIFIFTNLVKKLIKVSKYNFLKVKNITLRNKKTLKPYSQKTSQSNHTRTTALSNSMKPSHAHRAIQDGREWWRGLTECGPLEKGMASHFSILALRTP